MSYTPTNWQTGDTVTAEKLNNMESGIELANDVFVVTCTPTAQDLSGVMDKTVAEIDAAYKADKKILFKVLTGANSYAEVYCSIVVSNGSSTYPSYGGYTVDAIQDIFVYAFTAYTDDGDRTSYATAIYPLTPMS